MTASDENTLWQQLQQEAEQETVREPVLAAFLHQRILSQNGFSAALANHIAALLESATASTETLRDTFLEALDSDPAIVIAAIADITAIHQRDSACTDYSTPFLYYKGYHALQSYRVAHWLWRQGRHELAYFLQSQTSNRFSVDIHPAAQIGAGLKLDHANGIVIGETSVISDDVSIMQAVTLGGTGKTSGDRHPKIGRGVLIGAGSKILGNIRIGEGAQICAGSVVLEEVPPHTVAAGVPATIVGEPSEDMPSLYMDQQLKT